MQYLIPDKCLPFITDSGKKFPINTVYIVAPKSVRTFMIFIEIGLYSTIKINISE